MNSLKPISLAIALSLSAGASASAIENINITGFGSIGAAGTNETTGYAGLESGKIDIENQLFAGIQIDGRINNKAKFTTQVVADGRYDFEPSFEVAYLTYNADLATIRVGKLRTPFFMYSDYLDVGYAYPMLRPSQELYENIIVSNYTGGELLFQLEAGDTTIQLQPFVGKSLIKEENSRYGQVDLNNLMGLTAHWYVDDLTFRASYVQAETEYDYSGQYTITGVPASMLGGYIEEVLDNKKSEFISIGAQYDDGDSLVVAEAMEINVEGRYTDVRAFSLLAGHRFGEFMPFASISHNSSTDNSERSQAPVTFPMIHEGEKAVNNFEQTSYSLGLRWDFARNIALKGDVTFVDYNGTSGGNDKNVSATYKPVADNSVAYGISVDFVF